MTSGVAVSIVIPCLNEERRLPRCLDAIRDWAARRAEAVEVIVVDDGSTDGTSRVASAQVGGLPAVSVVRLEPNRGKGAAVREGVLAARGALIAFTDADLSVPLSTLDTLFDKLTTHDIAVASRALPQAKVLAGQGRLREGLAIAFDVLRRTLVVRGIRDTQCGLKAYRREAAHALYGDLVTRSQLFDIETFVLAARRGLRVAEVPAVWTHDPDSRIRYGPLRSLAVLVELLRMKWRYRIVWPLAVSSTFVPIVPEPSEARYTAEV